MGTTVSNLQILGASPEDVRAALPHALVGQWSERFVTACPDLSVRETERLAASLSKELVCSVLAVSLEAEGSLRLVLYKSGRLATSHIVFPGTGVYKAGKPKTFCSGLELPAKLIPKLELLLATCSDQAQKLAVLQALLGAPLFLGWDSTPPDAPLEADSAPLLQWCLEHKQRSNQAQAELLQKIPERWIENHEQEQAVIILRPAVRKNSRAGWYTHTYHMAGDILGYACTGGEWAHLLPDGHLAMMPLSDPPVPPEWQAVFTPDQPPDPGLSNCCYAVLGQRLVTFREILGRDLAGAFYPVQTAVVHDSAGILALPLELEDGPAAVEEPPLLLPDGGFLANIQSSSDHCSPARSRRSMLARFGPDGRSRWTLPLTGTIRFLTEQRIYAFAYEENLTGSRFIALDLDGQVTAHWPIPSTSDAVRLRVLNATPYLLEEHQVQRFTPDLQPDGAARVAAVDQIACSPDGTLLYCVSGCHGITLLDAATLRTLREQEQWGLRAPVVDGQNRLWVEHGEYFECYTPELECISRHPLQGNVYRAYRNDAGQVCAITFQENKCVLRVYRFV